MALIDPKGPFLALALDKRNVSAAVLGLLATCVALVACRRVRHSERWAAGAASLAAAVAVTCVVTTARVVIGPYDSGPLRPFSDRGFQATVEFLNRTVPPGVVILAPRDLGYACRGRFYSWETVLDDGGEEVADRIVRRPDVRYVVDSTKYPVFDDPSFFEHLPVSRIVTIGDYRVYIARDSAPRHVSE